MACLPSLIWANPYQRLLYQALNEEGVRLAPQLAFHLASLVRHRHDVAILHVHWPEGFWRTDGPLRRLKSMLLLCAFATRLAAARVLGYRVVWTVHQVYPHEQTAPLLDRLGATILAHAAARLIAHDEATRRSISAEFGDALGRKIRLVPHGSYLGVYPAAPSRAEARRRLGLDETDYVFLSFGHIRRYKGLPLLVEAFVSTPGDSLRLVVAGMPHDDEIEDVLRTAAQKDARIRLILEFVADAKVTELFAAADAAVVARADGGTSGALVLALSQGTPVIHVRVPTYVDLVGRAGWTFEAGDPAELARVLAGAADDADGTRARAEAAAARVERFSWRVVAGATRAVFLEALSGA